MPTITKRKKQPQTSSLAQKDRIKIYNSVRWREVRRVKLMNDPLCEMCAEEGRTAPAEDIHHITSFMSTNDPVKRRWLAYDYSNLMSLCKQCHQKIHNSNEYRKH